MSRLVVQTTWGKICVNADHGAVRDCRLPMLLSEPARPFAWGRAVIEADTTADRRALEAARLFLRKTFKGEKARRPPLHWPNGTPFAQRVWKALTDLRPGECVEYGELAQRIGRPMRARAVGRACKANPLPLFIPCHRVVPKNGALGGFSPGLPWKRLLLEREKWHGSRAHEVDWHRMCAL
jgi:O-6-methylguanine DNA methyltransferase